MTLLNSDSIVCATPKGSKPAPLGKAEIKQAVAARAGKLPVPARKSTGTTKPGAKASEVKVLDKTSKEFKAAAAAVKPIAAKPEPKKAGAVLNPLAIIADPKKDGIPPELQVQNRKPLTKEQQELLAQLKASKAVEDAKKKPAPAPLSKPKAALAKTARSSYDWDAAEKLAKDGKVPPLPGFASYGVHIKDIFDLAKKSDAPGIREYMKKFVDAEGSRAKMFRFSKLCLQAIKI